MKKGEIKLDVASVRNPENRMGITRRQFIKLASIIAASNLLGAINPPPCFPLKPFPKPFNDEIPKIRVLGIGGAGCRAVEYLFKSGLKGLEFIAADMDWEALNINSCPVKIPLHGEHVRGFICGANPDLGYRSILESKEIIRRYLEGNDLVLIVAGMGGSTGTGGAPVVAQINKELELLS